MKNFARLTPSLRCLFASCALAAMLAVPARAAAQAAPDLGSAQTTPGFGVMVHYLPGKNEIGDVRRFDVEAFANALAQMRASYLIFTLGQNSGQYLAPNAALEAMCPRSAKNRPPRDLPMDIARALKSRGISTILYLPFRAPQADSYLLGCLGDDSEQLPPSSRFIANWSAVIRDWSDHYGPLAAGWWFDGTYNTLGMSSTDWSTLCAAARSGAPQRLLAFNKGEGAERFSMQSAPCQNWMAGEYNDPPARLVAPPSALVFHVVTPLGAWWGKPSAARFSAAQLRTWIGAAQARKGLFTVDMALDSNDRLLPAQIALVRSATAPAKP